MTPLATVEIKTSRLLLRRLVAADAEALFEMHADPQVMRFSNSAPWSGIDQAHDLIARSGQWLASGRHICLGLCRADTGRLIGTCTLYDIDRANQRAELGFVLGSSAWRSGYMSEALAAVLKLAFDDLELRRVEADTDPGNQAAIRLLHRLGFQREGLLRERWLVDGRKSDAAFYGLLREEWHRCRDHSTAPTPDAASVHTATVRQAVMADLDEISVLFDQFRQFQGKAPDLQACRTFLRERFDHGESIVFLATVKGRSAGMAQLYPSYSSTALARAFILNDLFVAEAGRRAGVATALLQAVEQYAWAFGACRVTLNVAQSNVTAQDVYRARGWAQDREFFMFHRFPPQA